MVFKVDIYYICIYDFYVFKFISRNGGKFNILVDFRKENKIDNFINDVIIKIN